MLFLMVLAVFGSQIKMAWLQRLCLPLSGVVFHKSQICHTNTSIIWCREKQTNSNPQEFNKSLLDLCKPTSQHQNSQGNCITDEHGLSFGQPRAESYTLPQKSSFEHPEPAFPPLDTAEDKLISALHTLDEPNPWYQHVATTNPYLHIIEFTELAYSYNVRVALQQMHFKKRQHSAQSLAGIHRSAWNHCTQKQNLDPSLCNKIHRFVPMWLANHHPRIRMSRVLTLDALAVDFKIVTGSKHSRQLACEFKSC